MPSEEQKPVVDMPVKSSNEILSELFESFHAEPPLIIKKEKSDSPSGKKNKKSKKKHKHKDKKHKKKDKKKKRSSSGDRSEIDLAEILIKQEKESSEQKIKIEGTDLSVSIESIKKEKNVESKQAAKESQESKSDKKIEIKLKSSTLELLKRSQSESGEVSGSDDSSNEKRHKKRKHKHEHREKSKKKRKCEDSKHNEEKKILKVEDLRNKIEANHRNKEKKERDKESRSRSREKKKSSDKRSKSRSRSKEKRDRSKDRRSRSRERRDKRSRSWSNEFYKGKDYDKNRERKREHRSRDRDKDDYKNKKDAKENPFYKDRDDDFWHRDRYKDNHDRDRHRRDRSSSTDSSHIDKKKLLEIARKNAIQMMKSGSLPGALTLGPQAKEKVIAAIKAGGKTVEELTDFCKTLSKKEALGELSSNSDGNGTDSDTDRPFHHPFQIKDRPTSITMNIKNSVPLPIKSTQERTSELRLQFPVSSGQLHRKTENEWVPVSPKKPEPVPAPKAFVPASAPLAIEAPPPAKELEAVSSTAAVPGPQIFPQNTVNSTVDIGAIVSERLTALRRLQENPNDPQALSQMYRSNKEMQSWAQSKQQPGQFTGTTGAQILSQAELSAGYQAWAKKAFIRSLCQGSSCGFWLSLVTYLTGSANISHTSFWRYGYAPSPKNGMETWRRFG